MCSVAIIYETVGIRTHSPNLQHLVLEFLEDIEKVFETKTYFVEVLKIDKNVTF